MDAPQIVPLEHGRFALRLTREERRVLADLPGQLRALVEADDPAVERLFPAAYPEDPDREADYRRMVGGELRAGRLASLDVVEATIDAGELDRDQLSAWLGALNDLRLVLGTRLEVTEDDPEVTEDEEPEPAEGDPALALYHYLGWLVAQAVDALAEDAGFGTEP